MDAGNAINLDEYKSTGTHWTELYMNAKNEHTLIPLG